MPYHAITCLIICEGWPCQCWCHEGESDGAQSEHLSAECGTMGEHKAARNLRSTDPGLTTSPAKES